MNSPVETGPWRVLAVGPGAAGARAAFDQARDLLAADVRIDESVERALERLAAEPLDVLLLDTAVAFPNFLERARERAPGVPILLLGSDRDRALVEAALRRGVEEVLSCDPVDPLQLARAVRAAGQRARLRRSLRERGDRAHGLQTVLLELAKGDLSDEEEAVRRLVRGSARTLGVERVGLWVFNDDRSAIVCRALVRLSADDVERGAVLRAPDYPRYFASLEESRVLPADDAVADPRTSEFAAGYLRPLGITSMMDVPVRVQGRLVGVICHEHVGPPREWTVDEQAFASSLADLAALALEAAERRRAEGALREERNFIAALLESTSSMVAALDAEGRIVRANRAFFHALGWPAAQALGRPFLELALAPEDADVVRPAFAAPPSSESGTSFEHAWVTRDGARPRVAWTLTVVRGGGGGIRNFVVSGTDVTERTALEEQLIHDAFHDSLTGLPNRALFLDRLGQSIRHAQRRKDRLFAVLFLDLDRFKTVNDSLGHMAGDRLLVEVARRLERCVRPGDTVARFGGDEFTVLLEDVRDTADAAAVAARIHKQLRQPFELAEHELTPTASIGIAMSAMGYERAEDLLRDADLAMYRAKGKGGSCHEIFDRSMHSRAVTLLKMESELRQAVERREFVVWYQPVVSLRDGRITGFEALARWAPPGRGVVSPTDFIPICEDTGIIIPLDRWILRQAAETLRAWRARYPALGPLTMSVNFSGRQFVQPDLAEHVRDVLREVGLEPGALAIELTESVLLDGAPETAEVLREIHQAGARLYLDDFGTGYSSLSYLHKFPIDALKIDRSFVSSMTPEGGGREIVRTIVALARSLSLQVVAEGVESDAQREALVQLGCDAFQGFVFSRPVPAAEVPPLLERA